MLEKSWETLYFMANPALLLISRLCAPRIPAMEEVDKVEKV